MKRPAVVDQAAHAVLHPVETTAQVVGVARGLAATAVHLAEGARDRVLGQASDQPPPWPSEEFTPAAEQREPEEPHESFATEPSAVDRSSEHGEGGHDETIDDWYAEDGDDPLPDGVVATLEAGDPVGDPVDHAAIKETLSEAETMRRAAERQPE